LRGDDHADGTVVDGLHRFYFPENPFEIYRNVCHVLFLLSR
jgi:hypothetical protein